MADILGSTFTNVLGRNLLFENVDLSGTKIINANLSYSIISDANLSNVEINGAQLGGAYIHHIDMPAKNHPNYEGDSKQRPLRFEECYFGGSSFTNCNLENVEIDNCQLTGLKINGILVKELLKIYDKSN